MIAPALARPRSPASRVVRWRNTPERIRGLIALILLLAVGLGVVLAVIFSDVAAGVRVIGDQAAPEVRASTDLYFRLNDMDAQVANITFAGERAAAERTLYAYQVYERYDRRLRALARRGDLSGAIAFDTSLAPGNSNWAFYRYDKALVAVIRINQNAFAGAIGASQSDTPGWTSLIPAGAILAIIVLTFAGARSRLTEYR